MKNRKKISLVMLVIVVTIIIALIISDRVFAENVAEDKPNVILIMADALRFDHLGCYGYSRSTTPNIDKLAAKGVVFDQAFVMAPTTMASTASVLTSLYPRQHQAWNMHGEEGVKGINDCLVTLSEILKDNGYKTIGIVSNGHLDSAFGFGQGFDEYYETWKFPGADNFLADAKHTTEIIVPWIKKNSQDNFFIFLFFIDPHDPYEPSPAFNKFQNDYNGQLKDLGDGMHSYLNKVILGKASLNTEDIDYLEALYDGEIAYWDWHVSKIIEALEDSNILDNTIIIITSDHGEEFSDHGGVFHGYAIYNEHLHVPLIISGPQLSKAKSRVSSVVRSIDIMPTIFDLLNIEKTEGIMGKSLLPLLESGSTQKDRLFFSEMHLKGAYGKNVHLLSLLKDDWKLIFDLQHNRYEMYDLSNDPGEKNNLAASNTDKLKQLSKVLSEFASLKSLVEGFGQKEPRQVEQSAIENLKSLGYIQ
ncbi:MAG: sulfatase [Candidatus Omnitrophota bacterium]